MHPYFYILKDITGETLVYNIPNIGTIFEKYEIYIDKSNYNLWAVRPIGDSDFNSPNLKYFKTQDEALVYKALQEFHAKGCNIDSFSHKVTKGDLEC